MKSILRLIVVIAIPFVVTGMQAQNWTTVSASNITDLNQNKLAAGQLCFLGTDQNDNPISFGAGGGGQVLKRPFCSPVAAGAVTAFTVPNPANTQPAGIYYRATVKDTSTGQEVLRYTQVTFTGGTFSFDNYQPNLPGAALNPPTGNSVTGNFSVSGNGNITGSLTVGSFNPTVLTSGQFTSNTANPAGAGILRLASSDAIDWRNNGNSANIPLQKTGAASSGVPADTLDASGFGGFKLASPAISSEAAAPAGVSGADVLYADSIAHRWKMINNNGSADTVLGAATADTVSNKTLNGPSSGNSVTLLNQQGPASAITGDGTDHTLYSYTLPANALGPGKGIKLTFCWLHNSGSATVTYKIFAGTTTLFSNAHAPNFSPDTVNECVVLRLFNNPGVQNAQNFMYDGVLNYSGSGGNPDLPYDPVVGTASVDFTSSEAIKATFNVANTDQVTPQWWLIELVQ